MNFIDIPNSTFIAGVEETVAANLAYGIATRGENCAWLPTAKMPMPIKKICGVKPNSPNLGQ